MPVTLNINTDDNFNQEQTFNIEGTTYILSTYYNFRKGWYVGLYDVNRNPIRIGVNLMPVARVFDDVPDIEGQIWCAPTEDFTDPVPVTRDNFGAGKLYNLVYLTNEEFIEFTTQPL